MDERFPEPISSGEAVVDLAQLGVVLLRDHRRRGEVPQRRLRILLQRHFRPGAARDEERSEQSGANGGPRG